jgi:hypothetical protein
MRAIDVAFSLAACFTTVRRNVSYTLRVIHLRETETGFDGLWTAVQNLSTPVSVSVSRKWITPFIKSNVEFEIYFNRYQ